MPRGLPPAAVSSAERPLAARARLLDEAVEESRHRLGALERRPAGEADVDGGDVGRLDGRGGGDRRGGAPAPGRGPSPAPGGRRRAAARRWGDRSSRAGAGAGGPRYSSSTRRPWLPARRRRSGSRPRRARRGSAAARFEAGRGRHPEEALRAELRLVGGRSARSVLTTATSTWPAAASRARLDRVGGGDLEAQRRPLGEEAPQDRQQQRLAQVVAGGDPQRGHPRGGHLVEQRLERGRLVEQAGQAAEQRLAGGARPDAAARPSRTAPGRTAARCGGSAARPPRRSCAAGAPPRPPSRSAPPPARRERRG